MTGITGDLLLILEASAAISMPVVILKMTSEEKNYAFTLISIIPTVHECFRVSYTIIRPYSVAPMHHSVTNTRWSRKSTAESPIWEKPLWVWDLNQFLIEWSKYHNSVLQFLNWRTAHSFRFELIHTIDLCMILLLPRNHYLNLTLWN